MADFIQVPPDSPGGKKIYAPESTQGADDVHTQVMSIGDRNDPSHRQAVDVEGAATTKYPTGAPTFDAFGLMLTSEPNLLGSYKFYESDEATRFTKIVDGTADVVFDASLGGILLTTGTAAGDRVRYMSDRRYAYRPGATNNVTFTLKAGDVGKTNLIRRVGWFGDDEHMAFEWSDTSQYVSMKNTLTATTIRRERAEWNGDRLDGLGGDYNRSGVTFDATKINVWWIDYQYLGAGAIRFGTWIDGKQVVCHTEGNYNTLDRPYLKSPNLAFGIEQYNEGGITASSSEMQLSCSVVSSSGYDEHATKSSGYSETFTVTSQTFEPIFSFRASQLLNGIDNRYRAMPILFNIVSDTEVVEVLAELSPTLTGATWLKSAMGLEIDTEATASVPQAGTPKLGVFTGINVPTLFHLEDLFPRYTDGLHRDWDITKAERVMTISARLLNGTTSKVGLNLTVQLRE